MGRVEAMWWSSFLENSKKQKRFAAAVTAIVMILKPGPITCNPAITPPRLESYSKGSAGRW